MQATRFDPVRVVDSVTSIVTAAAAMLLDGGEGDSKAAVVGFAA